MTLLAQAAELQIPQVEYSAIAPELLLAAGAMLLLLTAVAEGYRILTTAVGAVVAAALGIWLLIAGTTVPGIVLVAVAAGTAGVAIGTRDRPLVHQGWLAAILVFGAFALTAWQWTALYDVAGSQRYLGGSIVVDGVALYTRFTVLLSALLILPIGHGYLLDRGIYRYEYEPILLLSVTGMTVLGAAGDLLIVFIAIELLSLALYVLTGLARRDRRSQEASIKYFVMGAVASAILLYGIALLYTATGSIDIGTIAQGMSIVSVPIGVVLLAVAMVTVGMGFKAAAVPFHFWTPDVYQGAPTNVTGFMAAATKAAAFAALLRIFQLGFGRLDDTWVPMVAVVAALSMLLGAFAAIVQRDVKRVLAYSSIAHVGYALVGVVSVDTAQAGQGISSTLFYLLTYAVTAVGAFGCVVAIERRRRGEVALIDLKGLARHSPILAGIFSLCLLSLAGIPATAGFMGKFAVFRAGVNAGLTWLVVVGVVSSVVAAFFYLRLMAAMFLEEPEEGTSAPVLTTGLSAGVSAAAAAVVVLGILPSAFITLAEQAASIAR